MPLDRVWFFGLAVLNRVYNLTCLCPKQVKTCPKQGMVLQAERLQPRLRGVSFFSWLATRGLREVERAIERAINRRTSDALLFLSCIISTGNRRLTGHYNVINQHQTIFFGQEYHCCRYLNLKYFSTYQYYNKRSLTEQIVLVGLVSLSWVTR